MPEIDSPLLRLLEKLDGKEVTVKVRAEGSQEKDDRELAERVARQLNREGGPKIRSSAIV